MFGRCVEQSTGQRAPPGRAQPPRRHGEQQRMGEAEKDLTLTGVAGHDALLVQFHDGFGRDDRGQGVVRQRLAQRQHVARFGRRRRDVLDPALRQLAETGPHIGVARPPPHATDLRQPAGGHPEPDQFRQVQRVAGRAVNRQAVNGHAVTENRCCTGYVDTASAGRSPQIGGVQVPDPVPTGPAGRTHIGMARYHRWRPLALDGWLRGLPLGLLLRLGGGSSSPGKIPGSAGLVPGPAPPPVAPAHRSPGAATDLGPQGLRHHRPRVRFAGRYPTKQTTITG